MKTTDYSKLTPRETSYLKLMESQYLVPILMGAPGIAKTAIIASIAKKIGAQLIDLRLATMDETDLGVYPVPSKENGYTILDHAVPKWASQTADGKPYIIAFEELNRASKSVRDAALGVLLEKRIGYNFSFGENVLMIATGNLGTEDGTEVEELDTALKSRLITIQHKMELDEWITTYAKEHVHKDVVRYLEAHPTAFYPDIKKQDTDGRTIVNPRTWTGLSVYLLKHFGKESGVGEYGSEMEGQAKYYIGSYAIQWLKWLRDHQRIVVADVLEGRIKDYGKLLKTLPSARENLNEVASDLKTLGILAIEAKGMKEVIKLFRAIDEDVMYGFVWDLIQTHSGEQQTEASKLFVKEFKKELQKLVKDNERLNKTEAKK